MSCDSFQVALHSWAESDSLRSSVPDISVLVIAEGTKETCGHSCHTQRHPVPCQRNSQGRDACPLDLGQLLGGFICIPYPRLSTQSLKFTDDPVSKRTGVPDWVVQLVGVSSHALKGCKFNA